MSCFTDWSKRRHVTFVFIECWTRHGRQFNIQKCWTVTWLQRWTSDSSYLDVGLTTVHHLYSVSMNKCVWYASLLTLPEQYAEQGPWNERASVCPSVCLSHRSIATSACGAIDCGLRRSAANAGSVMMTAERRGWTQTCSYMHSSKQFMPFQRRRREQNIFQDHKLATSSFRVAR